MNAYACVNALTCKSHLQEGNSQQNIGSVRRIQNLSLGFSEIAMSAYRRLNRTCRTITFQHPAYAVFQSTPINAITNGMSSSDNDVSDELMNSSASCSSIRANSTVNDGNAANAMATTCNDLNHNNNLSANSSSDDQQVQLVNSTTTNFPSQPKHVRFPDVPYHSELLNELMMFAYTIIAAALQFMHLYRTVWWLPESNTNQTMVNSIFSTYIYARNGLEAQQSHTPI